MSKNSGSIDDPRWRTDVLAFWFDELEPQDWFIKNDTLDQRIEGAFLDLYAQVSRQSGFDDLGDGRDALAHILVLDQFPRNMFRDTPKAFATDAAALQISKNAISSGFDSGLTPRQRQFLYMPFQHSEDRADQVRSVELYAALGLDDALDFARRHKAVIDQFGRFPHRNKILGRTSTVEELAYLKLPGSGF